MCCSPPPIEILVVGTRPLPSNVVASPCRNDVTKASTCVCDGAVLFCQTNLRYCHHVCQSSVVFLWALLDVTLAQGVNRPLEGILARPVSTTLLAFLAISLWNPWQTLAASTLQQRSGVSRSANLRQALWPHMIESTTSYSSRESIWILHAVFEVILPFRRFEHAVGARTISPTLRSRSPCASWAPRSEFVRAKPLAFPALHLSAREGCPGHCDTLFTGRIRADWWDLLQSG